MRGKVWVFDGVAASVSVFVPPSGDGTISTKTDEYIHEIEVSQTTLRSFAKWLMDQTDPDPEKRDGDT